MASNVSAKSSTLRRYIHFQTYNFTVALTCDGCIKQANKVLGKLGG